VKEIILTRCTNKGNIHINPDNIACYYDADEHGTKTKIEFTNGLIHVVQEDRNYIAAKLKALQEVL